MVAAGDEAEVEEVEERTVDEGAGESGNESFVEIEDDGWVFVSRCVVAMLATDVAVITLGTVTLTLLLLCSLAATPAPSLCRIVMSNTLG